jgi:hypothetical protein
MRYAVCPATGGTNEHRGIMAKQLYLQPTHEPDLYASVWSTDLQRMNIALVHQATSETKYFDEHGPLILDHHVVAMVSPILENTKGVGVEFRTNPEKPGYVLSTGGFEMDVPATVSKAKPYDLYRSITKEDIVGAQQDVTMDYALFAPALRELGVTRRASASIIIRGVASTYALELQYNAKNVVIPVAEVRRGFKIMVQARHLLLSTKELADFGVKEGGFSTSRDSDKLMRMWASIDQPGPTLGLSFLWRTG